MSLGDMWQPGSLHKEPDDNYKQDLLPSQAEFIREREVVRSRSHSDNLTAASNEEYDLIHELSDGLFGQKNV